MTSHDGPKRYGHVDFNSPIAPWRADRLVHDLAAASPATIADIGCGWGELLLRLAAAVPAASAVGIDGDTELLDRGRANAEARGLAERVRFVEYLGEDWTEPADLVVCSGAAHAFGGTAPALAGLAKLVNPGGRLLFGDAFWERIPTEAELATMWPGTTVEEMLPLPELVDAGIGAGLRPLQVTSVERGEWEYFESGFLADKETWLLEHPDDERAEQIREGVDEHRNWWLRGHRGLVGYAYVTFGRPVR
ncbi:methyltransferase domain-containing protein [Glycomyces buryatensis]|uniref:Class I SAM-dependent methyltransferase n=1 Tax=Glycomyces buryatensis TaxID=2570927 RepID=A0A4S8PYY6_9ACTN|nr:methyltransferase domain-containing protein [Glycomyces buryatensis]THV33459.1 class I SAM-dependent methyltransferase [Glycomyces buryatensis]